MANVIIAQVTTDALKLWPQMFIGLQPFKLVTSFKIGEGGWVDQGSGPTPRLPDPNLRRFDNQIQDLDAIVDPTRPPNAFRYPTDSLFTFSKAFVPGDFAFQAPSAFRCRCFLDLPEANDDGFGNNPNFYEIGLFTDHPVFPGSQSLMVAYGTFPLEVKTPGRQLENIVVVYWSGV